ncbi:ribonuclease H-like domain-containing protein [Tanacetum coccineum]
MTIYGRVMTFYQDKQAAGVGLVLWGDLKVLIDSPEVNDGSDVWKNQNTWNVQSWKLYSYSGVHVLEIVGGLVIHMFVDKKYPLSVNLIERMLDHQLEICQETVGNELTTAVQLIAFLKKQIADSRRPKVHDCAGRTNVIPAGSTILFLLLESLKAKIIRASNSQWFQVLKRLENGVQSFYGFDLSGPCFDADVSCQLAGQETTLPHAFTTGILQDPAPGNWNMDTGASSHLNDSVNNLSDVFNSCIYPSVAVGDGHSIPVTNSGNIKFDPFGFSVKDFQTRRILLRCNSTGPLYPVTNPSSIPQTDIKSFQYDHGGKFDNHAFHKLFADNGIQFRFSCSRTSQQNGKSERMIRTINNIIRTLLFQAHLPPNYWAEALNMAVYLLNILPSRAIENEVPFTRLFGTKPDYSLLRVFGYLCYPHLDTEHKLGAQATPSIFLGHASNHRGYRCLDLNTNKIIISRHATFDETVFPFGSMTPNFTRQTQSTTLPATETTSHINIPLPTHATNNSPSNQQPNPVSVSQDPPSITINPNPVLTHPMVTRSRVGTNRPTQCLNLHVSSISPLPKSYNASFNDPNWQNAMTDEQNALINNNTWILVPRPMDANIIRCMWLFRHKFLADGTLSRYKARLVANGSTQIEGIDVDETFSLVVKPGTIRMVLSLALSRHWPVHQLDVKNAFLHEISLRSQAGSSGLVSAFRCLCSSASSESLLQRVIASLHNEFSMTDLGPLNYFLGISVTRDSLGMFLSQRKYATEILEQAHMANCNPSRTPVDTETKLGDDGDPVSDPTLYRSLAGSLQYLTFTRPDILYVVQQVCLHMHDPREPHFSALKRILRYVRESPEYRGVANAVAETCWLRNLLCELHTPLSPATLVYYDNVSVVYLSSNLVQHQRLPTALFEEFRSNLSVRCPPAQTAGEC